MSSDVLWGIHCDNRDVDFLGTSTISIAWGELGDLSEIANDRAAFKERAAQAYPDESVGTTGSWAGVLFRFVHEMKVGDYVVYSRKADKSFSVGRISGDYEYRSAAEWNPNVRAVEWLRTAEPREAFSDRARSEMASMMTLFQPTTTAPEFVQFIETGEHTEKVDSAPMPTDVEDDGSARALEALLPAEFSDDLVSVMVESILHSAAVAPNAWALTLVTDGNTVRLNVGSTQVWHLRERAVFIEVLDAAVDSEVLAQLSADGRVEKWSEGGAHSAIEVAGESIATDWPALRAAHFERIEQLAPSSPTGGTPHWQSHRPALVDALAGLSGAELPQPTYAATGISFMSGGRIASANALLRELSIAGPTVLSELLARDNAAELFKADTESVSRRHAIALMRLCRELGLVHGGAQNLELTDQGRSYVAAGDPDNVWDLTELQSTIVRSQIQEQALSQSGVGICGTAVLALSLWSTVETPASVSLSDYGRALAIVGNGTSWKKAATHGAQGSAYTIFLKDAGLLNDDRSLTRDGEGLLREVDIPSHASLADALQYGTDPADINDQALAAVWWVNQGDTYKDSVDEGLLWAPKVNTRGTTEGHWTRLTEAQVGDLVVQYSNGAIRAVATVQQAAEDRERPDFASNSESWNTDGWGVGIDSRELEAALMLAEIPSALRTAAAGPFTYDGSVKQGYFFPVSPECVNGLAARFPQLGFVAGATTTSATPRAPKPALDEIVSLIQGGGLRLSEQTIRRYHLSIETRGFVILAGLSGSGKTQLAKQYSDAVRAKMLLVPVAPNWTANEDLLGYLNPMDGEYVDTEFSRFLSKASAEFQSARDEDREPLDYHLILDEMNLARVEYYFAKFLSAMELISGPEPPSIELGGEQVQLTPNLKFIGTVNVDETTHGFADKVYDRAQLIEIPVDRDQVAEHVGDRPYRTMLLDLYDALLDVAPFAYRVLDNISNYVDAAAEAGVSWQDATDEQILQKVLPKVKGTAPRVGAALSEVVKLTDEGFPLSNAKARQMSDAFRDHGFVSFF
jgi:hypothetical protein